MFQSVVDQQVDRPTYKYVIRSHPFIAIGLPIASALGGVGKGWDLLRNHVEITRLEKSARNNSAWYKSTW